MDKVKKALLVSIGMIVGAPLLIVAAIALSFGWDVSFITLKIGDRFSGPIAVRYSAEGATGRGFSKWRSYEVPSDGVLMIRDKERFHDWHRLRVVRTSGTPVPVFTPPGDPPKGIFVFAGPTSATGNIGSAAQWIAVSTVWYYVGTDTELKEWVSTSKPW